MADASTFGGGTAQDAAAWQPSADSGFGSGLGNMGDAGMPDPTPVAAVPSAPPTPSNDGIFGSGLKAFGGAHYAPPDPQTSPLDQTADMLQQRITRANAIATNPIASFFSPESVQKARDFVPAATEQLQKIKAQKADMMANRAQAANLGLAPGDVPDEASQADRVEVAKSRALTGDLRVFKGLQAVDPKAAEAIQDQVHEVVAGHLTNAQYAFDSLSGMQNQGQYQAKLAEMRQKGILKDLESLGLKVPETYGQFSSAKAIEGQALREARIGVDKTRQALEERNTYQPMEKKEAETYNGRMTTAYGDQITNGTWGRNGASGTRGLIVNGAADPRDLGKTFTLATPEQRKSIEEESDKNVPKDEREKYRAFNRTYQLATTDAKGNKMPDGSINTNPNVQQGIAEGLASMLRGGQGGANIGLLKIETNKRGFIQALIDKIETEKGATLNELKGADVNPYLTKLTQGQIRDVMDTLKQYNDKSVGDRVSKIAERAGALGLDAAALGYGDKESSGAVQDALDRGRQAQIERMTPQHQAIGGGDGVFQLGAQRPGAGATGMPAGSAATTQLPGAQPLQTPVQQANNPPAGGPPSPPAGPSQAPSGATGTGPAGGSPPPLSTPPAPMTIAGQSISVALPPGASPNFVQALQRIESGGEKNPWTSGTKNSSASGAFQFIKGTWDANKPAGAPDRAGDATPIQQAQALATLTAKSAQALQGAGLPVNDTTLYIAHNLGSGGAGSLLQAAPNADARSTVGEVAAKNNPTFFKGRPTVATVLQRYQDAMNAPDTGGPKPLPGSGGATAEAPGLMTRISRMLSQGVAGGPEAQDKAVAGVGQAATQNAPAIGSTVGAIGGSVAGPVGTVAGGAAGGGAGQALKDYLQGNPQSPTEIAKQTALGGVLGVGGAARPVLSAAARTAGAGAVEGGAAAAEGGDAGDITSAATKGLTEGFGGEAFGRALGMGGHKLWGMFAPEAKTAVREAATKFSDAEAVLKTEAPKLPGAAGAASTPNPKYEAAIAAKEEAETTLKDVGIKPEEAAYAHKVSSEGVPKQEAQVAKPLAMEQRNIGAGYQQLESEVGAAGRGAPKATPKLTDGPVAAVTNGKVSVKHMELAAHAEVAITAPAPDWATKWNQLKDARSQLLTAERDALTSTATGKSKTAADMRTLADTVRVQQEKVAKYVFGPKDGEAFMGRLKVLDVRYRNLMDATNHGDIAAAARMTGEAGRDADRKFRAFAHDDPTAIAAWNAMRKGGSNVEKDVRTLVGAEGIPVLGKVISAAKMAGSFKEWLADRAAGSTAKFADFVSMPRDETGKAVRDVLGTAAQRGAVQQ